MAVTNDQYQQMLIRLTRIEQALNDVITAMNQFVQLSQVSQVLTVLSTQLEDMRIDVDALGERMTTLENEPLS